MAIQTRPSWSDISNASLQALIKSLGVLVMVVIVFVTLIGVWIFQSLETLRSINSNLPDSEVPAEVIVVDAEVIIVEE